MISWRRPILEKVTTISCSTKGTWNESKIPQIDDPHFRDHAGDSLSADSADMQEDIDCSVASTPVASRHTIIVRLIGSMM